MSDRDWDAYAMDSSRFRVIVRQKPNPIGFRATLPGDKRK